MAKLEFADWNKGKSFQAGFGIIATDGESNSANSGIFIEMLPSDSNERRERAIERGQEVVRRWNAHTELLAALKIALPYVESFDSDNADLQTKANAETVRAVIQKAKGEK